MRVKKNDAIIHGCMYLQRARRAKSRGRNTCALGEGHSAPNNEALRFSGNPKSLTTERAEYESKSGLRSIFYAGKYAFLVILKLYYNLSNGLRSSNFINAASVFRVIDNFFVLM